jgi:hypothetical protein
MSIVFAPEASHDFEGALMIDPATLGVAGAVFTAAARLVVHFAGRGRRRATAARTTFSTLTITTEEVLQVTEQAADGQIETRSVRSIKRLYTAKNGPASESGRISGRLR